MFQYLTVELLQQKMVAQLSASISKKIILSPRNNYQQDNIKEKANRFFEIITIQKTVAMLVTDGLSILIQTVIGLILLSLYHPYFIPFNFFLAGFIYLVVKYHNSEAKITSIQESTAKFAVAGFLQDAASTEARLQNEHISLKFLTHADRLIENYIIGRKSHFRVLFSQACIFLCLYAIINAGLLGLGGYLITIGQLSVGQLVAAEIIINGISIQFVYSMKHLQLVYDLYASSDKLSWLLDLKEVPVREARHKLYQIDMDLPVPFEFKDVPLGYEQTRLLNVLLEPGSYLEFRYNDSRVQEQIIGYLLKNEDLVEGDILAQGFSYKDLSSLDVRNLVHNIDEPIIFDGSVLENLLDFESNYKASDVYDVLKKFDLQERVFAFPNKLNQRLHAASSLLSHSQKYRLCLARIYMHKPKLLTIQVGHELFSPAVFGRYLQEFRDINCAVFSYVHDETIDSVFKTQCLEYRAEA